MCTTSIAPGARASCSRARPALAATERRRTRRGSPAKRVRPLSPVAEVPAHHPPEERRRGPRSAPRQLSLLPFQQLDVVADPPRGSPPQTAASSILNGRSSQTIVSAVRDDEIAELALVVAVDHPALRCGVHRLVHPRAELLVGRLAPVRPVVERVQLDVRQLEPPRELDPERRLPRSGRALEVDALHREGGDERVEVRAPAVLGNRRKDVVPDRREASDQLRQARRPHDEPPVEVLAAVAPAAHVDTADLADGADRALDPREQDPSSAASSSGRSPGSA